MGVNVDVDTMATSVPGTVKPFRAEHEPNKPGCLMTKGQNICAARSIKF